MRSGQGQLKPLNSLQWKRIHSATFRKKDKHDSVGSLIGRAEQRVARPTVISLLSKYF